MFSLPLLDRLASAHAVFCGQHGDVSHLARQRGVPRQTLYRQADALLRDADPARHQHQLDSLRQRVAELQAEADRLRHQLQHAVVLDDDVLGQFAATAQATGVSLSNARTLLCVLRNEIPSVATLGRLSQHAGQRASAAVAVLDEFTRPRAKQLAPDEIFVGQRMVLMTIEQQSLCWLGGRLADSRDSTQWAQEFRQFPAAEQVTRDGGQGMEKGLKVVNAERKKAGQPAVADQDDHFHIAHRGRRALRQVRGKAERAYRTAEKAQAALKRDQRKGKVNNGRHAAVALRWRQAEAAMDRWSAHEKAFGRLRVGLKLFTPDGHLNTPQGAEAEVKAALDELTGPEWSRVRTKLAQAGVFTFLKEAQRRLEALPVAPELRQAAVRVEGLKRQPEVLREQTQQAAALRGVLLACSVALALAGAAGAEAVRRVRAVLAGVWRSSSLVEGVNGVLRMQQSRQKRMTQGLLDLKRVYWNTHVFVAGKRKKKSPYEHLGLQLPPGGWWHLLKLPPEQLRQQLSALNPST